MPAPERFLAVSLAGVLLTLVACSDPAPPTCATGLAPAGDRCVPVLDPCPGATEIPVLGGGCRTIGVTACATGFVADGEGGCAAVLPADPCPDGTRSVLGSADCAPVGVTACATGFVPDAEAGCLPILPTGPCDDTQLALPGMTTCTAVSDCGAGTWGNLVRDATTVHVDAAYGGADSDGSETRPFTALAPALSLAADHALVAVAAGDYAGSVDLVRPVRLAGVCAGRVTLTGTTTGDASGTVSIRSGASGSQVTGMTVTGPGLGFRVEAATDVYLHGLVVRDTEDAAISVAGGTVTVERVLLTRPRRYGLLLVGAGGLVDGVEVRETRPRPDGRGGTGLATWCTEAGACGEVTLRRSRFRDTRSSGAATQGATLRVEDTLIERTQPEASSNLSGIGIFGSCDDAIGRCGALTVSGSVVTDNHDFGILTYGTPVAVTQTVIRDTQVAVADGKNGLGVAFYCGWEADQCEGFTLADSLLLRNHGVGLLVEGADALATGLEVRGTLPVDDSQSGAGVLAQCATYVPRCGRLTVERSRIADNPGGGVVALGFEAIVREVVVQRSGATDTSFRGAAGIQVSCDHAVAQCGSADLEASLVEDCLGGGILLAGVPAAVRRTVVRGTRSRVLDGQFGRGLEIACDIDQAACAPAVIEDLEVADCQSLGVALFGIDAEARRITVRDTRPDDRDNPNGLGLEATCELELQRCGTLVLEDSLIARSNGAGVLLLGTPGQVSGLIVRDSAPFPAGDWAGQFGIGMTALCDASMPVPCATLEVEQSRITRSQTVGFQVLGVTGRLVSSVIDTVLPQPFDDRYGYGIQVAGDPGQTVGRLDVDQCRITGSNLASAIYVYAIGQVSRSELTGAAFSIVWTYPNLQPDVSADNLLEGSLNGVPSLQTSLHAAASPPPVTLVDDGSQDEAR